MAENLSVSWTEYQKNICKGLCALQQRGEFVDMTLAAEGYHVKVHQMVLSLVSPFIKDLISSANCPHPVIFLNKVSHQTMQSILEYAYTGEVVVSKEKMGEFLEACKDLHIKGLENMLQGTRTTFSENSIQSRSRKRRKSSPEETQETHEEIVYFAEDDTIQQIDVADEVKPDNILSEKEQDFVGSVNETNSENAVKKLQPASIQYSVSIYGNLQIVLNRYIYSFIHVRKNNQRYWRCINQQKTGCLAYITTVDDKIHERGHPHNHTFHDAQILKRIKNGNMFTSVSEVEDAAAAKKRKRDDEMTLRKALYTTDV